MSIALQFLPSTSSRLKIHLPQIDWPLTEHTSPHTPRIHLIRRSFPQPRYRRLAYQTITSKMAKEEEPIETTIPDVEVDPAINSPPSGASKAHKIPRSLTLSPPNSLLAAGKTLTLPFRRRGPTFPQFMLLPLEVRILIWESTMIPRVHELHPCAKLYNDKMTFRSNSAATPALFHVCSESRAVAEKHYELFQYEPPRSGTSGKAILRFWFCSTLR